MKPATATNQSSPDRIANPDTATVIMAMIEVALFQRSIK
jgi:hypothetical protein